MQKSELIQGKNWIYSLSGYLLCIVLIFGLLTNPGRLPWELALLDAVGSCTILAIMAFLVSNTLIYYHPTSYLFVFAGISALLLSLVWNLLIEYYQLLIYPEELLRMIEPLYWPRIVLGFFLFAVIIMVSWFSYRIRELEMRLSRQEEIDRIAKESELYMLRQQLQPHFLFNSLNSINALIGFNPEKARKMVLQLSDFFRGTLKRDDKKFIPFGEEIDHLRLYFEIEQVRFGHRLQVELNVTNETMPVSVPPLLLQPIMENAVKFGLYGTTGNVCIVLNASIEQGYLRIQVSNPFDADSSPVIKGTGFGLAAVQRRLYLLFARNDLLMVSKEDNRFILELNIPIL